jgi:calcineurin-like phosphoesterase family protein
MNTIDFKIKDASKVFFTSDTHFGHGNIIEFCNRPFKNAEEMDYKLIENWNKKVPHDGIVYHLGDFAWGGYEFWKNIRNQLNGSIILIKGNHDEKNMTPSAEQELFDFVTYQMKLEIEGRKVYLNHNPFLCYGGTYRDPKSLVYQLFGHVHSGPGAKGLDIERLGVLFPTQYDVGVDNNNYEPISWEEVNNAIGKQLLKSKFKTKK